jgi:hypothetical protein
MSAVTVRAAAAACGLYSTADVTALRKKWDKELVHAALALVKARGKAAVKFGAAATRLVADPEGVEMATSHAAAAWKARRFAAAGGRTRAVLDLCCGIGGDAMALHAAGLDVTCVDSDPVRAWMAVTTCVAARRWKPRERRTTLCDVPSIRDA